MLIGLSPYFTIDSNVITQLTYLIANIESRNSINSLISRGRKSRCSTKRHGSSERYPTPQEMQQLMSEFQRQITRLPETIKIAPVYEDRRSPLEKQQYESFIQAWTKIDPTIAPFLGSRQIIEDFLVYPSRIKGRVCIIQPYFVNEIENGVNLAIGKVENDRILTDAKQIIFVKKNYMGVAQVYRGKAIVSLLPPPKALPKLSTILYSQSKSIQEWLQRANCSDRLD